MVSTIYWILLVISGSYFLLSLFGLGDDTDVSIDMEGDMDLDSDSDVDSPKIFSLRVLGGAIMGFSIGALILHAKDFDIWTQLGGGFISAVILGIVAFYAAKFLYGFQGSSNTSMRSVIGNSGKICASATDQGGIAQIELGTIEGFKVYSCYPKDSRVKLKVGESVRVEEKQGNKLIVSRIK